MHISYFFLYVAPFSHLVAYLDYHGLHHADHAPAAYPKLARR